MIRRPHAPEFVAPLRLFTALCLCTLASAATATEPARKQSQIKGLLVVQLGSGEVAGTASQMNATVVPGKKGVFDIKFNQAVGSMMEKATAEVKKFMTVRHGDKLPLGYRTELAFADNYSPKDGPSAAVVSALLTDSIITGEDIDPDFAATGDMITTGEVRPVGGISGKVRGAIKKDCKIIGIPAPNQSSIEDLYIITGIEQLYQIQIFTLKSFDEAHNLALAKRGADLQKAIEEFSTVQTALKKNPKFISNSKVLAKLKAIVNLAPNHLSARTLYLHGIKKGPKKLSLPGSLTAIDTASNRFGRMLRDGSFMDTGHDDVLRDFISEMKRLHSMLDKRTTPYADTYEELADYMKTIRGRKILNPQMRRELDAKVRRVDNERTKLLENKEIREELMIE